MFAFFQSELSRAELEQKILFPGFNLAFAWVRYQTWMNVLASGGVAFRALGTLFGETKLPDYAPAKWASQEKHDGSSANSRNSMEALQRTRQQRAAAVSEYITPGAETPSDQRRTSVYLKAFRTPLVGIFSFIAMSRHLIDSPKT